MRSIPDNAIAIIGMACRLPGADCPDALWSRLIGRASRAESVSGPTHYALRDIAGFDPVFFGLSARDAALTDPQHRLFLMCAFEALENAGVGRPGCEVDIGVFAGCGFASYACDIVGSAENCGTSSFPETAAELQVLLGNAAAFMPSRVSHALNLTGPSVNVQAACATGLYAVHFACQSLRAGDCEMALAGAVAIRMPRDRVCVVEPGMILAADGCARPFDKAATGTVYGDGAGAVLLKPLDAAMRDGDPIHAVLRGSGIGNDGASGLGFAAPSIDGQTTAIRRALEASGCAPDSFGYVETHGTGTPLGDPIELAALAAAYGTGTRNSPCDLGAAKAVLGHTAEAAGIVGLISAVMAVKKRTVPPIRHFCKPNPRADLGAGPFRINTAPRLWGLPGPARAGVSSFGMGGCNAHAVIEVAQQAPSAVRPTENQPIVLSARSPDGLRHLARRLRYALVAQRTLYPLDIAFTLATTRRIHGFRGSFAAGSRHEFAIGLKKLETSDPPETVRSARPVWFLFSGDASPAAEQLGRLCGREKTVRAVIERVESALTRMGMEHMTPIQRPVDQAEPNGHVIRELAAFTVAMGLTELYTSWGVRPHSVLPVGPGRDVAAVLSGRRSIEEVLSARLINLRNDQMLPLCAVSSGVGRANGPVTVQIDVAIEAAMAEQISDSKSGLILNFGKSLGAALPDNFAEILTCNPDHPTALAQLFEYGVDIDWHAYFRARGARRCHLPPTPFELQPCWSGPAPTERPVISAAHPSTPGLSSLNAAARAYIKAAFTDLGVVDEKGRIDRARLRGSVARAHRRWASRLADILASTRSSADMRSQPTGRAAKLLLDRMGARLTEVLQGRADAREALFPGGRDTLAARFYRSMPSLRAMNRRAAEIVGDLVQTANTRLNVVEIGAGTLATTQAVLAGLPEAAIDYAVTDLGSSFVAKARRKLGDKSGVTIECLDIEKPVGLQGFAEGTYDIVIASNVLHATACIRTALGHVIALLRPGGHVIVIEGVSQEPWVDFVFGALPGWWRYLGDPLRPTHTLLASEAWTEIVQAAGLVPFSMLQSEGADEGGALPQMLLHCQKQVEDQIKANKAPEKPSTLGARSGSPRLDPDAIVVKLCAALIGETPSAISVETGLEMQGLDSLALLELRAALEQRLGRPVPHISGDDTPGGLAARLFERRPVTERGGACRLIELADGPAATPVIFFPSILGNITNLKALACRINCAGAALGVEVDPSVNPAIDHRANLVATELLAAHPKVSLTLVGHSYGGILAQATACELQRQGTSITLLAVLDIPARPVFAPAGMSEPSTSQTALSMMLRRAGYPQGTQERNTAFRDLAGRYHANLDALAAHRPAILRNTEQLLIRAQARHPDDEFLPDPEQTRTDPSWGWQRHSGRHVQKVIVPGDHMTMLDPPNVDVLAENLMVRLGK